MCRLKKIKRWNYYFNHQGWRHWIQLAHCGLIFLFVCCFYLLYFLWGSVLVSCWICAKVHQSLLFSKIITCDCYDVSDNRIEFTPKFFGFGKVHCSKTHAAWISDPGLACVSPWYEEYGKILNISNNFFLICNPVQSNRTAVEENICDLNMSLCFTTWSESF